jgi:hypothetical protein
MLPFHRSKQFEKPPFSSGFSSSAEACVESVCLFFKLYRYVQSGNIIATGLGRFLRKACNLPERLKNV